MQYHATSIENTLQILKSTKSGLTSSQASQRLDKFGKNKLKGKKKKGIFFRILEQFKDFMVIVLLISAIISFITSFIEQNSDYIDSIIILIIVSVNSIIGVIQEYKAEKAIDALQKITTPTTQVIRGGKEITIASEELVPGDIISLSAGKYVPADARLIDSNNLKVEESALTGESNSISKNHTHICKEKTPLAERKNMIFASSNITAGHCTAIVTNTGMYTEVGKIAHMINLTDQNKTPLQKKLSNTGKFLGICALCICFTIFIMGTMKGTNILEMFMISISLAVAAIPEGLPAVVTIVLALGVRRMALKQAIIRKLPAVETLGRATVICSDKTGTLTQNKMSVEKIFSASSSVKLDSAVGKNIISLASLCCNLNNNSTEKAILSSAQKISISKSELDYKYPKLNEIPFSSERKLMTTYHKLPNGKYRIITKGAPDILIKLCTQYTTNEGILYPTDKNFHNTFNTHNETLANEAMRVIAIAYKDTDQKIAQQHFEKDLIFVGLIGIIDPPRVEAKHAVRECIKAGIRPVMITGDQPATACAIAKNVGIIKSQDHNALLGIDIQNMSQEKLEQIVNNYSVFARVSPEHKVRIVKALQHNGEIVAMTGDGINDAPALKAADIGCAMGNTGTDVAKNAADMILTDDNFATIVSAVKEGRGIFENIKKTIRFLLSSNAGEIITVFVSFLLGMPTPLLAAQLLWVNLVTDSFPALALGVEPTDPNIMNKKFLSKKDSFFSGGTIYNIIIEGMFIGAISILAFVIGRCFYDLSETPTIGRTMAFGVLSLSQIIHAFNIRSERSIFYIGFFSNIKMLYSSFLCIILQVAVMSVPQLTYIFKTTCLTSEQWIIVTLLSLSPLILVEIEKFVSKNRC